MIDFLINLINTPAGVDLGIYYMVLLMPVWGIVILVGLWSLYKGK